MKLYFYKIKSSSFLLALALRFLAFDFLANYFSVESAAISAGGKGTKEPELPSTAAARLISFRPIDEQPKLSPHYDPKKNAIYLDQCFVEHQLIGRGNFGRVLRAKSRDDGRWYAVKEAPQSDPQLPPSRRLAELAIWERLLRGEKEGNSSVHGINPLYRAWLEKDGSSSVLFFQTELCRMDFAHFLVASNGSAISNNTIIWDFLGQMLQLLEHVHARGFVFADLKPENILLCGAKGERTSFRVNDFGLTHDPKTDNENVTRWICANAKPREYGQFMGEMRVDPCQLSPATDIFLLGKMVLDMVVPSTGEQQPNKSSIKAVVTEKENASPTAKGLLEPSIKLLPKRLAPVVAQMVANDPAERRTARELLEMVKNATTEMVAGNENDTIGTLLING